MNNIEIGLKFINFINNLGYEAYLVGGCVRDYLLKIDINDIDVTTNMPMNDLDKYFNVIDTGSNYSSVTIIYEGISFEVTHYRCDISYSDNRHPVVRDVSDYYTDSFRRDFTVNALAMSSDMKIIDYHNGIIDLNNKLLRIIGDGDIRFSEDSLRILRALHFSSKLDFVIEDNTLLSMNKCKNLLANISKERIYDYVIKLIYSNNSKGIDYIKKYNLFEYIPEYLNLINIANKDMNINDLPIYYYLKYNSYLYNTTKENKKYIKIILDIINDDTLLSLFKYQNEYNKVRDILYYVNYDIIKADGAINSFVIKSTKDLSLSAKEITDSVDNNMKSIVLDRIILKILNKEIDNTIEDIKKCLGE